MEQTPLSPRWIYPGILAVAALLLCSMSVMVSFAQAPKSATVTWIAPTTYVDGTVLPAASIDHYTITWPLAGGTSPSGSLISKTLSAVVPVVCGSVAFSVTVTTTAAALYPNSTSAPAGPVTYASGVSCAANPPGALAVH
jgi:hypothetical protein